MGTSQIAIFAAGCFWGVEEAFRTLPGVLKTTVGYIGGQTENPTYEQVCSHTTGHAEAVQIEFDPDKISYTRILEVFWMSHDPTSLNRQGPDIGDNYRSAIFYTSDEQRQQAEASKQALAQAGGVNKPIVTEITKASHFYPAEEYHQQYFVKNGLSACPV